MKRILVLPVLAGALLFAGCQISQSPAVAQTAPNSPPVLPGPDAVPAPDEPKKEEPKIVQEQPIAVSLQIAQNAFGRGKVVGFSITARNATKETQTLQFSSGQSFEITATPETLKEPKREALWRWSHDKFFAQALRSEKLAAGEAKTWTATWNQTDNNQAPLPRGKYIIEAWITANGNLKAAPSTIELMD